MRRFTEIFLIIFLSLIFVGCQNSLSRDPDITGYIIDKTNNTILVASETPKDLSENGGVTEFYDMIWFSNPPSTITLGDKIDIWYDAIDQSYPGRSKIEAYNIHKSEQPEGALCTESEVLEHVLSNFVIEPNQFIVIESLTFNEAENFWSVDLREILTQQVFTVVYFEKG